MDNDEVRWFVVRERVIRPKLAQNETIASLQEVKPVLKLVKFEVVPPHELQLITNIHQGSIPPCDASRF